MNQALNDYMQHFRASELGVDMYRVINGIQNIEDRRHRVLAPLMVSLLELDVTVGIEKGLIAALNALKDMRLQEADEFKALRDFIAQEVA